KAMDALRKTLVAQLQLEITKGLTDFTLALNESNPDSASRNIVLQNFYAGLKAAYEEKFAVAQAALLSQTRNFKLVRSSWTSLTAGLPLYFPTYTVSPSFAASLSDKHPLAANVVLGHTRMWVHNKLGKLFLTFDGSLLLNNSKLSYGLSKLNFSEYKSLGGTENLPVADQGNDRIYIGAYKTFLTPSLTARVVYFPSDSHVGFSVLAQQNFGNYNTLNMKLGLPLVLINSKKTPAVHVECFVLFFDLANKAPRIGKTYAGLALGIPFSRMMY
ncbi:MAG: hypothetical protein ABIU63_10405, partial [Chitinophagaceae bacterium]